MFRFSFGLRRHRFSPPPRRADRGCSSAQLFVERLEDRCMLSGLMPGLPLNPRDVTVMSQNLYIGADLTPALEALQQGDQMGAAMALGGIWDSVHKRDFETRAETFAAEIAAEQPALIGLQEVSQFIAGDIFRTDGTGVPGTAETIDYLDQLLSALESCGLNYAPVATTDEMSGPFRALLDVDVSGSEPVYTFQDIQFTDRDVILARTDLPSWQFSVTNVQEQHFPIEHCLRFLVAEDPDQYLTIWRGWNSVDVQVCGQEFRFINAHLEDYDPETPETGLAQMAQAGDLLAGPAATPMSVIMVGDFNSRADGLGTATYQQILIGMGGFTDAWTRAEGADPGYTWSDNPDLRGSSPLDPAAVDPQRIDLVLYRGDLQAVDTERVIWPISNDDPDGPLWPSDHAGVAATLALHVAPNGKELPWAVVNDDPESPGETAAFIMGTATADRVSVTQRGNGDLAVTMAPSPKTTIIRPSAAGHVYVLTGGGNDTITIAARVVRDAVIDAGNGNDAVFGGAGNDLVYGGAGNDVLFGEAGSDILVGDAGNDTLFGGKGNDLLIGGSGKDSLAGQAGEDILIGGSTTLDSNAEALWAVMAEWTARRPIGARIANLENGGGLNGSWRVGKATSVRDDAVRDRLSGGAGDDWFLAFASDILLDRTRRDRVS